MSSVQINVQSLNECLLNAQQVPIWPVNTTKLIEDVQLSENECRIRCSFILLSSNL